MNFSAINSALSSYRDISWGSCVYPLPPMLLQLSSHRSSKCKLFTGLGGSCGVCEAAFCTQVRIVVFPLTRVGFRISRPTDSSGIACFAVCFFHHWNLWGKSVCSLAFHVHVSELSQHVGGSPAGIACFRCLVLPALEFCGGELHCARMAGSLFGEITVSDAKKHGPERRASAVLSCTISSCDRRDFTTSSAAHPCVPLHWQSKTWATRWEWWWMERSRRLNSRRTCHSSRIPEI